MKKYIMAVTVCLVTGFLAVLAFLPAMVSADVDQSASNAAVTSGSTVSGLIPVYTGWAAYSIPYAGDNSTVTITLNTSPTDFSTDQGVTFNIYSPQDPPPGGAVFDTAGPGNQLSQKVWNLNSNVDGNWVIIVQNYDLQQRPIQFTLSTTDGTGAPGPALTFISSGPQPGS